MRVRVTLMTENKVPVSAVGENPEQKARIAWEMICEMLTMMGEDNIYVENVEIVEGEADE